MVRKSNSWITFIIRVWSKSYSDWWSYVALSYTTLSKFVAKKPFQVWYQNEKQGAFPYRWTNALPFASLTQPEKKSYGLGLGLGLRLDFDERTSVKVTSHESRVMSQSRHPYRIGRQTNDLSQIERDLAFLDLIQTRRVRDERWEGIHFISFHFIQREKGSTNSISRIEREGHSEDDQPAL